MFAMDGFWNFAGNYWWLVFPLGGVLTSAFWTVNGQVKDASKRRHKRRLEILEAKARLRASSAQPAVAQLPRESVESAPSQAAQIQRAMDIHDSVTARWLDYELDVAKLIAFPAMSDGRQDLTARFLRAKKVADRLRPAAPDTKLSKDEVTEYRDAVTDFEVAFDLAERDARRQKDAAFSETERARLDTAKRLLNLAVDEAATPAERQSAYRRVRQQLDGLIDVSDDAYDVLKERVGLQLPPGSPA